VGGSAPLLQHSSTSLLQHSGTPLLQYSSTPVLQHSSTPVLHYSSTPAIQYSSAPVLQHSSTLATLQPANFRLVPVPRICQKHRAPNSPRQQWTRTVCVTPKKSMSQTFGSVDALTSRLPLRVWYSRAWLNPKPPPRKPGLLPPRNRRRLLPPHRRLRKLKRKRQFNPSPHRPRIPPLNRPLPRHQQNPRKLLNRRQRRLLPDPAQFQPLLRSHFRLKPCRLLISNFKTHCKFGACIQRNCYTTR